MALTYSAADFFILPSREDNLPNTMLESIACGTPVISFPIGDTQELLEDSGCGILTNEISTEAIEDAMKEGQLKTDFFKNDLIVNFSQHNFASNSIASKYHQEYHKII